MANNIYTQHYADGSSALKRRRDKQGRKPSGLAKPRLYRLRQDDVGLLDALKNRLGYLYNENEIVRDAVHRGLSVYTELVKH